MALKGTPLGGRSEIAKRYLIDGPDTTLVLYTNTRNSLGDNTVTSDLTQPNVTNGYTPLTLVKTGWTELNGVLTYQHPAGPNTDFLNNPCWVPTGAWSATVTGAAMVFGNRVLHFKDATDGAGTPLDYVAVAGLRYSVSLADLIGP